MEHGQHEPPQCANPVREREQGPVPDSATSGERQRAFVAGLIAFEKLIPSRRLATYGTAGVLLALGVLMLVAPDVIPALTIPGDGIMSEMDPMGP